MLGLYSWRCFCYKGAANPLPVSHRHNEVELTYLSDGRMSYDLGGKIVGVPERQLCLFWGGISHRCNFWAGGGRISVICLPMSFILGAGLPHGFLKKLFAGDLLRESQAEYAAWDDSQMQIWERDLGKAEPAIHAIVESEIETRLRRIALGTDGEPAVKSTSGDALSRLLTLLCAHASESATVSDIAARAGLHAKYASRLFKSSLGITALEFLHRLRVSHAQRLLSTTSLRVLEVAFESGFNSASQFYEAFERICGESPGSFRKKQRRKESGHPGNEFAHGRTLSETRRVGKRIPTQG